MYPSLFWSLSEEHAFSVWGTTHIFSGRLFIFVFFWPGFVFFWVPGSLLSLLLCFSASLLFCFLLFLPLCFSAFLLFAFLLLSAFHAPLLFCFCASVPFSLYYSTFFLSHVFLLLYLLPAPLLLCVLSWLSLCFSLSFPLFILSCLYPKWNPRETLGETQRNPDKQSWSETLYTWNPKWTPKNNKLTLKKP